MHLESLSAPMTIKNVRSRQGGRPPIFRTRDRSRMAPQEDPTLRKSRQREHKLMFTVKNHAVVKGIADSYPR